jgi:hypothetical protein
VSRRLTSLTLLTASASLLYLVHALHRLHPGRVGDPPDMAVKKVARKGKKVDGPSPWPAFEPPWPPPPVLHDPPPRARHSPQCYFAYKARESGWAHPPDCEVELRLARGNDFDGSPFIRLARVVAESSPGRGRGELSPWRVLWLEDVPGRPEGPGRSAASGPRF